MAVISPPDTGRLLSERLFHDRQAATRRRDLVGSALLFRDEDYLGHAPWIRPAMASFGSLRGLRVLDYGCGHGMAAVVMARRGAGVTAVDLSAGYVREARERANANGVVIQVCQADAERLPFPDACFDGVWGHAIVHHLHTERAAAEVARVLRPGGTAVFCEPWGGNPVIEFARRRLPYRGKHRTPDERPLRRSDLAAVAASFASLRVEGFDLFGSLGRAAPRLTRYLRLRRFDRWLTRRVPAAWSLCRYVVLTGVTRP